MTFEWELASAKRIAREEGLKEGLEQGQIELVKSILDHISPEEAAKIGIPMDLITAIINA